jgi:hypothetical protein
MTRGESLIWEVLQKPRTSIDEQHGIMRHDFLFFFRRERIHAVGYSVDYVLLVISNMRSYITPFNVHFQLCPCGLLLAATTTAMLFFCVQHNFF